LIGRDGEFPNVQDDVIVTIDGEELGRFADIKSFKKSWTNWTNMQK